MLILSRDDFDNALPIRSLVLVFGVGLIGSHIIKELLRRSYRVSYNFSYSWHDSEARKYDLKKIAECCCNLTNQLSPNPYSRIDLLWSAGKGGFGMSEKDVSAEFISFSDVVTFAHSLSASLSMCHPLRFHMISSAGGLFEGQRNVKSTSIPDAKRPYSFLKMQQEELLYSSSSLVTVVYRLSSVYGFSSLYSRLGLIPTLLWNGNTNRVSIIFGSPDTLRDYVWVSDVAEYITRMIESKNNEAKKLILASGKPTSLFEISMHVRRFLKKQILLRYIKDGGNSAHNTFSMETHPEGWVPSDLETGIRKTGLLLFT